MNRRLSALLVLVLVSAGAVALWWWKGSVPSVPAELSDVAVSPPRPITALALTDHHGEAVSPQRLRGAWTMLFFGYTHCPDVCPATLSQLVLLNRRLQARSAEPPQFFFVSVDPQRDSIEQLAGYIGYFDASFTAMTGDMESVRALESQLRAVHRFGTPGQGGFYSVDHTASVFLIDPDARWVARFDPPLTLERVSEQYEVLQRVHAGSQG